MFRMEKVKKKKKKGQRLGRSSVIGERTFANCGELWHFLLTKIINNTWSRPITHCFGVLAEANSVAKGHRETFQIIQMRMNF
jgi:hypothetical protein